MIEKFLHLFHKFSSVVGPMLSKHTTTALSGLGGGTGSQDGSALSPLVGYEGPHGAIQSHGQHDYPHNTDKSQTYAVLQIILIQSIGSGSGIIKIQIILPDPASSIFSYF